VGVIHLLEELSVLSSLDDRRKQNVKQTLSTVVIDKHSHVKISI